MGNTTEIYGDRRVAAGFTKRIVDSQALTHVERGGQVVARIRHDDVDQCHDCAVKHGQVHVYGCDAETCPFCGDQMAFCDCYGDSVTLIGKK